MNSIKSVIISGIALFFFAGCGASKAALDINSKLVKAPLNVNKKSPIKEVDLKRWSHLDLVKDTIPGMSVDKAYSELLKNKKGVKVIVAILDSGVDIRHKELKSVLWVNKKEIPGNGIDDDNNGYIDDINGWNFIGNITKENYEFDRTLRNKNNVDEVAYQEAQIAHENQLKESVRGKEQLEIMLKILSDHVAVLSNYLGKISYTIEELKTIVSQDPVVQISKTNIEKILTSGVTLEERKIAIQKQLDDYINFINGVNQKIDFRKVVGDNPEDITDTKYGNNNVMGPDTETILHGTHVAGIVAQVRNNGLGGDGIANNVEIMAIRAVPMGDEYDKDIALGIRYAVDNGAKVINGSFGKDFSPHKQWVYDAIKYAESKDVLIVHAAGNDSKDIDVENNFPNDSDDKVTEFADNVITIGALNYEYGNKVVAKFSNYGKLNVDVFAPGVKIYATTPNNSYAYLQGTSMASPNVAGVAALIRSYYPKLTAQQVKHIIMDTGVTITNDVIVGGNPRDVRSFTTLSRSGKIVNAYNALLTAQKMSRNL